MSQPKPPQPAKLIIGLFMKNRALLEDLSNGPANGPANDLTHGLVHDLAAAFGTIDMVSPWFSFDYTDYYAAEMGGPLYRRMLVFEELIAQESLARIKCTTNVLERQYALNDKRQVNIDPGYLLYERFVLATGKNFTHRIYIGEQIYADLTLIYQQGQYRTLPWTYPDYADENMRAFLMKVRNKYAADINRLPESVNR